MRRPDGVTIVSIVHFVEAGLFLLIACVLIMVPFIVSTATRGDAEAREIALPIVTVVMSILIGIFFLYGAANAVIGWGLWQMQPWGRLGAIVLSVLRCLNIPVGTVIGGLILWYLFQPEAVEAFEGRAAALEP
jgi:hypothetical protein